MSTFSAQDQSRMMLIICSSLADTGALNDVCLTLTQPSPINIDIYPILLEG